MKNLYGLLIAINEYPNPAHCLKGCINDRNHFKAFLEENYGGRYRLHLETLSDGEATRSNIVKGFEHFGQADDGDLCLLFFAGHGSQMPAPPEFAHLEAGSRLETIVCYDSRQPGGRDLIDKELSYLIWKAAQGKDVHFTAIMDCCHSGSNTRDEVELEVFARNVDGREDGIQARDFLGYEHYQRSEQGFLTPPRARHVLLAASQPNETAKEIRGHGMNRGVFSFCLLEALATAGQPLSYAEAVQRATLRVRGLVRNQSPSLEADEASDKELEFLSREGKKGPNAFFVSYDQDKGWLASAGAIHGVSMGLEKHKPAFRLVETGEPVAVTGVQASFSSVAGMEGKNTKKRYEAYLVQEPQASVRLAFSPDAAPEGRAVLAEACRRMQPRLFTIQEDAASADYLIYAEGGKWALALPFSKRPLFQRVGPFAETGAEDFLKKLESVAKWRQVLDMSGPLGAVQDHEFSLQLERIAETGNYTYGARAEAADWRAPLLLEYQQYQGAWHVPAFRLKVKNTGHRKLWASALYLEDNFGISNELLPGAELAPGDEKWLEDRSGHYPTNAIRIWMHDVYRQWGISSIREYLKVFISTERLNTDGLNQKGLPYEGPIEGLRGFGQPPEVSASGWAARAVELNIRRPLE